MKKEGESEGETEPAVPDASVVDNPRVLTWVERAEARALEAAKGHPAAGADAVVVQFGGPRSNGEAS